MALISLNPATNKVIKKYYVHEDLEIKKILESGLKSQKYWSRLELGKRLEPVLQMSSYLKDNNLELSKMITQEMGKPLKQSILEIDKCADLCDYYNKNSTKILADIDYKIDGQKSFVSYQPLGLILGIMPWNFPFWQVFRFAIPCLIVGNGALLKHSSNVQGCAKLIEKSFRMVGFPKNIFKNIVIPGSKVSEIIKNPSIAAVSLTGSNKVGISVATDAASVLKKTVLELGGSDPYIILSDADLNQSAESCINGRILNAGQSCISAKRIIVIDTIYDQFLEILLKKLSKKKIGDPMTDVDLGPMVSLNARDEIHKQVLESVKKGAKIIMGGYISKSIGSYYPLTLLSNVKPGMPAFDDELFGPVFSIIKANNDKDAIALANLSEFGLGASVFTKDIIRGEDIAKNKIFSGSCFVNDFVKSDPRLPFGGIKQSGYGRELASHGMLEFVNIKTIVIKSN
tara:strand:+ start:5007 stop:6377 length:1371 start_codon:yes stop_codon:yes gene_type:complete